MGIGKIAKMWKYFSQEGLGRNPWERKEKLLTTKILLACLHSLGPTNSICDEGRNCSGIERLPNKMQGVWSSMNSKQQSLFCAGFPAGFLSFICFLCGILQKNHFLRLSLQPPFHFLSRGKKGKHLFDPTNMINVISLLAQSLNISLRMTNDGCKHLGSNNDCSKD